jgi:hypothetical protein
MAPRTSTHRYEDPLDRVWLGLVERLGFRVARADHAYASTDGKGTIYVGTPATLDADDGLAQMLLHEVCHLLTEGPAAAGKLDWGLCNETDRDVPREHACLRLQAALTAPFGLRRFFAPTTDFRAMYDELPADPLAPRHDPASIAARTALLRARHSPFSPHLEEALAATARIVGAASSFVTASSAANAAHALAHVKADADADADVAFEAAPSLLGVVDPVVERHPGGLPLALPGTPATRETCATCAWRFDGGKGPARPRCHQLAARPVENAWPACERWEPLPDCRECGACCREAYGAVQLSNREPLVKTRPDLISRQHLSLELLRDGERCAALGGGRDPGELYTCTVYDDRPRTCRDFALGGEHCLTARRRVGLSL